MPAYDGIWRVEEHPHDAVVLIAVRYTDDVQDGRRRHVAQMPDSNRPRRWFDEDTAQRWCDAHNPPPAYREGGSLSPAELLWLHRLAVADEGRMERATSTTLLALEHKGLAASRPEPGRRLMDRWTITETGRNALSQEKE